MQCEIREIGPICHVDQSPKSINNLTDIQLIDLLKEMKIVMESFRWD